MNDGWLDPDTIGVIVLIIVVSVVLIAGKLQNRNRKKDRMPST